MVARPRHIAPRVHRLAVAADRHRGRVERGRQAREARGEGMLRARHVQAPPPPGVHVLAERRPQVRYRARERARKDGGPVGIRR
jgi:hypothetical protein